MNTQESLLIQLVEKLTGTSYASPDRRQHLFIHTYSLMQELRIETYTELLQLVSVNSKIFAKFVSCITIHTTSWFRESDQFEQLALQVTHLVTQGHRTIKIWCAACSTGQEVYSMAFKLESLKRTLGAFTYHIEGSDIDGISVQTAQKGIYPTADLPHIPSDYHRFVEMGSDGQKFKIRDELLNCCSFRVVNIDQDLPEKFTQVFDIVFCRNLLIYFHPRKVSEIVEKLMNTMRTGGFLFLASSEALFQKIHGLEKRSTAIYQKTESSRPVQEKRTPRILVVDDSALERKILSTTFRRVGYEVEVAESALQAMKILENQKIDLITLDLEMPHKTGSVWLREIRAKGYLTPVIVVSASDPEDAAVVFGALNFGAQDFCDKAGHFADPSVLLATVDAILFPKPQTDLFVPPQAIPQWVADKKSPDVIAIGASTGGPEAIWQLLRQIPRPTPPILVVQHTNEFFASHFAQTVKTASGLELSGLKEGEPLAPNTLYISQADAHLAVKEVSGRLVVQLDHGPMEHSHRPAVDPLFRSLAGTNANILAMVLTGMGSDGCQGSQKLFKNSRSYIMAQARESCVVFGMPREVVHARCVHFVGDIPQLRMKLIEIIAAKTRPDLPGPTRRIS